MATNFLDALMNMQGWEGALGQQRRPGLEQQLLGQGRSGDWIGWLLSRGSTGGTAPNDLSNWSMYPKMVSNRREADVKAFNKAVKDATAAAMEKYRLVLPKAPGATSEPTPTPEGTPTPEPAPTPGATPATSGKATGATMSLAATSPLAAAPSIDLDDISEVGRQLGLDDDSIRVAQAIAQTEGALAGDVGDTGNSYGPYQFHRKGMLPAYASSLGMDVDSAAEYARQNPIDAVEWALSGYLGKAIKDGAALGLRGEALAEYVQRHGQRSQEPHRARTSYRGMFGGR